MLGIFVPTVAGKAFLVVPAQRDVLPAVAEPLPVDVVQEAVHERRDLRVGKILAGHDHPGVEQAGIDGGQLALPGPGPGVHFHEVVEETVMAGGGGGEEAQCGANPLEGYGAGNPATLRGDHPSREGKPGGCNAGLALAGGSVGVGAVPHQAGARMDLLRKKEESLVLDLVQQPVVSLAQGGWWTRLVGGDGSAGRRQKQEGCQAGDAKVWFA